MTQKEKKLLLQDLCARLPYGLIVQYKEKSFCPQGEYTVDVKIENDNMLQYRLKHLDFKPYLRPMSSMTEEERRELNNQGYTKIAGESWHYCALNLNNAFYNPEGYKYVKINYVISLLDWLNAHHFDYRGLIENGLALEAPEGMYD